MTRVLQLGNYGDDGGGISSVLREFASWDWPTSEQAFVDTYATDPRLWGIRRVVVAATTLIRNRRSIDVVHAHLSQKGSYLREGALVRLASALGLRVVVTLHGSSGVEFTRRFPRLVRGVLRHADAIASLTEPTKRVLEDLGIENVTVVPNAVRDDEIQTSPEEFDHRHSVVFAGAVSKRKGVDVLLDAWREVSTARPEARLEVYGPPVDVEVPQDETIRVHGRQSRNDVRRAVSGARALVLPSRAEAFPMAILEAMAAGVPVVATDVGSVAHMLDDIDFVVPVDDVPMLAEVLIAVLGDPRRAEEAGKRNRERYRSMFSPVVVARRYEELYRP